MADEHAVGPGAARGPPVPRSADFLGTRASTRRLDAEVDSTATTSLRSLRAPVTPPRHLQLLATTLALVALVVRLLLPLLHDPRAHAAVGDAGGAAVGCACVEAASAMPWWQLRGDADGADDAGNDERERDGEQIAAAPAAGHCLACAEAQLPPAPPPPLLDVPQLTAAPAPTIAAPRAPPQLAAERSQHHSRAPPHAQA